MHLPLRTTVYIDGFNLYYGALKGTPYRWLDLDRFCRLLLPKNDITSIKYFTARVGGRPQDLDQPVRQQTYLRALSTLPNVSIIYGHFISKPVVAYLANPQPHANRRVTVIRTEEKGSDVNLATHLLCDGFHDEYEMAVIVTNDSDLLEPIKFVRYTLNKGVGIINPHKHPSRELLKHATFVKQVRQGVLRTSQFPLTVTDGQTRIKKPSLW